MAPPIQSSIDKLDELLALTKCNNEITEARYDHFSKPVVRTRTQDLAPVPQMEVDGKMKQVLTTASVIHSIINHSPNAVFNVVLTDDVIGTNITTKKSTLVWKRRHTDETWKKGVRSTMDWVKTPNRS